jgi:hypothetical protein
MNKKSIIDQDLSFPEAPEFMTDQVVFSATEMARMCEQMLPFWNRQRYANPDPSFVGEEFELPPQSSRLS